MLVEAILALAGKLLSTPQDKLEFEKVAREADAKDREALIAQIQAVNATMQAEAKSEHWAQWMWRPIVGFTFAATIINNYVLMPYLQRYLQPVVIPENVWWAMLAILGVSAGTRGVEKILAYRNGNGKPATQPRERRDP